MALYFHYTVVWIGLAAQMAHTVDIKYTVTCPPFTQSNASLFTSVVLHGIDNFASLLPHHAEVSLWPTAENKGKETSNTSCSSSAFVAPQKRKYLSTLEKCPSSQQTPIFSLLHLAAEVSLVVTFHASTSYCFWNMFEVSLLYFKPFLNPDCGMRMGQEE